MTNKFYQIYNQGTGLTNQLCSLINMICKEKDTTVYINGFLTQFDDMNSATDISRIIDLDYLNQQLKYKKLQIYDSFNKFQIKVNNIRLDNLDITGYFDLEPSPEVYIEKSILMDNFNTSDKSMVYLNYDILYDTKPFKTNINVKFSLKNDIIISTPEHYYFNKVMPNKSQEFEKVLKNIRFKQSLNEIVDQSLKSMHINLIHLKLEPDAITHYCKLAKMSYNEFENLLVKKYIDLIDKNITPSPNQMTVMISSTFHDKIIQHLQSKNIPFFVQPKLYKERELNAIQDYLLATNYCNGVFICAWDPKTHSGSTFSYFLSKTLKKQAKIIYFTPDSLISKEQSPIKRASGFRITRK